MPRQASASAQFQGGLWSYLFISLWLIVIVVIIRAKILWLFRKRIPWKYFTIYHKYIESIYPFKHETTFQILFHSAKEIWKLICRNLLKGLEIWRVSCVELGYGQHSVTTNWIWILLNWLSLHKKINVIS